MNSRVKFAWVIALPFSASALFGQAALRLEPGDEIATAVERAVARQKPGESVEVVLSDGVYECQAPGLGCHFVDAVRSGRVEGL